MNPGDTGPDVAAGVLAPPGPLNEGRGVNPGDTSASASGSCSARPLNEGRGVNPGDTRNAETPASTSSTAQRRPGREPRRHALTAPWKVRNVARSTKAGA